MTAGPFLLQMPDPDQYPSRSLKNGFDTLVIYANTAADAQAMAKSLFGTIWGSALVTPVALAPATDFSGYIFRVTLYDNTSLQVADLVVKADGAATGDAAATGVLTSTQNYADGETVTVGTRVYTIQATLTAGDGHVHLGASEAATITNLVNAMNDSGGTQGTDYNVTAADPNVTAASGTHTVTVTAKVLGTGGNSVATTTTALHATWGSTHLTGGANVTNTVSALAEKMVTALNGAGIGISGASYNTGTDTLTIAAGSDGKGNYTFTTGFYPPDFGYSQIAANANASVPGDESTDYFPNPNPAINLGVSTLKGYTIPGMVTATTQGGSAGSALTAVLVADTYTVPTLLVNARYWE